MGPMASVYDIQVFHPDVEHIKNKLGGESIDVIADKSEAIAGIFAACAACISCTESPTSTQFPGPRPISFRPNSIGSGWGFLFAQVSPETMLVK